MFLSKQFLIFLLTGGVAAMVNFGSRIFFNLFIPFSWSVVCSYIFGMITAFILAKLFVFRTTNNSTQESAFYFILVNVVALIQTWLVSMGMLLYVMPCVGVDFYAEEISHIIGIIVPVFSSYLGHKYISFK